MFDYDEFAVFIVKLQEAFVKQGQERQEAFNNAVVVWLLKSSFKNI
ncbi:hypothetical protein IDE12_000366 [Enterococcus faecium]|nr:hypothetical protein [Enterococcus faecium]